MVCDRVLEGSAAQALAARAMPFGPGLDDVTWVTRVEIWLTEDHEHVDFTEFRVCAGSQRRKTIRIAGY